MRFNFLMETIVRSALCNTPISTLGHFATQNWRPTPAVVIHIQAALQSTALNTNYPKGLAMIDERMLIFLDIDNVVNDEVLGMGAALRHAA
jgi:hypothetical protein